MNLKYFNLPYISIGYAYEKFKITSYLNFLIIIITKFRYVHKIIRLIVFIVTLYIQSSILEARLI